MKRKLFVLLIGAILLLAGCNNGNADEDSEKNENSDETQTNEENQEEEIEDVVEEPEVEEELVEEEPESVEVEYQINSETWSVEPLADASEDVVLLTIDDAPADNALEMAKTLKGLDAKAIFFVNGHFLETDEEKAVLKEIYDMGFPIGNHTYTHKNLKEISEEEQREEIVGLNDLVEEIIGERPKFFRAPHGANTDYSTDLAKDEGMVVMNWTYGYDYFTPYQDADKLATAMITGEGPEVDVPYSLLKPGANLLMHDRDWTAAALEEIVTGLRDKGYEMVDPAAIQKVNES
ncbi:polysaccharide deacetylase family protein [Paraliobacillus sediminis]|uniref:polysaccharide deacetylase family protein n=1 Tax=Paraliobacillus sediminis TaxID=1885916 RepID=UPI000E3BDA49|nr:polysaccharide deacetylase family protein [Paraliobacillus sediminis]